MLLRVGFERLSASRYSVKASEGRERKSVLFEEGTDSETAPGPASDGGTPGRQRLASFARQGAPFLRVLDSLQPIGGWQKRLADILIAGSALVLVAPLVVLISLLIRATSKGPAIFAHERIGFGGRTFRCYKFRTMVVDSDRLLAEYLASNPIAAQQWRDSQKLSWDPRVTSLGYVLRRSSLDELPQLFNILRGDMSCVGPRPIVREELDRYGSFAREYLSARPGLTGLWQVTGRSRTDYAHRVSLDTQYIRTWSLWSDLTILCRTGSAVLRFNDAC